MFHYRENAKTKYMNIWMKITGVGAQELAICSMYIQDIHSMYVMEEKMERGQKPKENPAGPNWFQSGQVLGHYFRIRTGGPKPNLVNLGN